MERVKRAKPVRLSLSKKTNPSIRSCENKDRARAIKYAVFPRRKGNSSEAGLRQRASLCAAGARPGWALIPWRSSEPPGIREIAQAPTRTRKAEHPCELADGVWRRVRASNMPLVRGHAGPRQL